MIESRKERRIIEFAIDGLKLHCELAGPEEAPPVLLLHGFPVNGEMWKPLCDLLQDRLRLINPDLRGFGRSDGSEHTTMATYVDDCIRLLDAIGETRPVMVMGLSMGGYLAFEFFRRARARLSSLVLVDTRAEPDGEEGRKVRFATADRVLAEGTRVVADAMIDKVFATEVAPEMKAYWYELMCRSDAKGAAAALRAMAGRADSTTTFAHIDVPTLIIVGEEDAITPPADSRKMHAGIRGSKLEIIARAGHMAPVEQPQLVASVVSEFVDRL